MTDAAPFPDAETVAVELLKTWLVDIAPGAVIGTVIPDTEPVKESLLRGAVYVRVQRVGGNAINRVIDGPVMEIACFTSTRAESWRIQRELHARLVGWYGDVPLPNGEVATVTGVQHAKDPTQIPGLNPDERRVTARFLFKTRRPRH